MRAVLLLSLLSLPGLWSQACAARAPAAPALGAVDWSQPWREPRDSAAAARRADEYAWRLFVALNWPADEGARAADSVARFGADRPVVWETWAGAGEVYLEDGADPGPWVTGRATRPLRAERRFETFALQDLLKVRHIVGGAMVPLTDPLMTARRLTEIRMNSGTFEYIRARELYNLEGQLRAYGEATEVSFPYGAKEIKAKWRPIAAGESSRYHTTVVTFADGTKRLYGLTGLHIASKDLPHWFWATFEQVDNPSLKDSEGWQLPSKDRFSCRSQPADCNRAPAGIGLEGTVWQYYRLRGTLTKFVDGDGKAQLLANSELETGLQTSASCITCHARSTIGVVAGSAARLPIFDSGQGATGAGARVGGGPGAQVGGEPDARARRGFSGLPLSEWYEGSSSGSGSQRHPVFRSLDFVWSLSNAQPKKGSAHVAPSLSRNQNLSPGLVASGGGFEIEGNSQ
jgi:hypothetical protein